MRCQRKLSGTYGGWGVSRVKPRATLLRVLLAVALATATCVREGYSQSQCGRDCPNNPIQRPGPPLQVPGAPTDSGNNKNLLFYLVGGAAIFIGLVAIVGQQLGNPGPTSPAAAPPSPPPPPPPHLPPIAQLPPGPPAPQAPAANQGARALKPSCNLPPVGETRYTNHVVADMDARTTNAQLLAFGTRHR